MAQKVRILDAGFSTQLTLHVSEKVDGDPLWTARFLSTNPEAILKTHLDFLRAGSEYIKTSTYQASIPGFMQYLNVSKEDAFDLIRKAVQLADEATAIYKTECPDANVNVVGSIGPYGAALHDLSEYTGNYADKISFEELIEWHRPRFEEMIKAGVNIFAFETIPCQKEAEALVMLLSEYPTVKAWISFYCQDDNTLAHGEQFKDVAIKIYESNPNQIIAVGVNCLNPNNVHNLFNGINNDRKDTIPLIVYPNSGEKYMDDYRWEVCVCKPLMDFVEDWLALGVLYIGGCCRTSAKDIKLMKNKIMELQKSS